MKFTLLLISLKLLLLVFPAMSLIVVDQFGYMIDGRKVAIIKVPHTGQDSGQHSTQPGSLFYVRNIETDEIVFEGTVVSWSNGAEDGQYSINFDVRGYRPVYICAE